MKKRLAVLLVLVAFPVFAGTKTMECVLQGVSERVVFALPEKDGDKPSIDFVYPVKVSLYSLRNNNLLLMAVDSEDSSRPRLFISAQKAASKSGYAGQFMTDAGGNALQLDNGPVLCHLKQLNRPG
ncbi:hypothetical protein DIZ81_12135 [Legionella taurinensis]|uniref:C-type lysozyme inhibitor domain-containing protein n=1 Tax=Legionella taurinensis TaxID=70611 RepID=A0A3A5L251_9GAMM|nr:hypothetical protein [Legionella taurinensis]MDX1838490.1 hypothetical protein [Legionella taurinensis]PUT38932.1 hypothetical protein DB744_12145 [Legionella taurinensis]PUT40993.1 hypothetical protein DB746_10540 [Legionella taurinensis]PUT43225.1 hypothetical protein DB743_11540 [Legionella taurinensis]PUT46411.1 hypothetical protein DB745_11025 [Legionella taurinensis]